MSDSLLVSVLYSQDPYILQDFVSLTLRYTHLLTPLCIENSDGNLVTDKSLSEGITVRVKLLRYIKRRRKESGLRSCSRQEYKVYDDESCRLLYP